MRAINLIPTDQQRGRTSGGRSGGLSYVLLGALTLLAALTVVYGLTARAAHDKQAELVDVTARAAAAERTANALAAYTSFTDARSQRTQAVATLANARVDWAHVLHELARTMPSSAWLTSVHAKTGAATATPGSGSTAPANPATAGPSVDLTGCTTAQSAVPVLIADLRRMDGVTGARLSTAAAGNAASGTAGASGSSAGASSTGASGSGGPCAKPGRVTFSLTLSFRATASPAAAPATATATAGSTP
jgi:Tfp pilus assembly protein PilN